MNIKRLLITLISIFPMNISAVEFFAEDSKEAKALLAADWKPVEDHFKKPSSAMLKKLYKDPKKILMTSFEIVSKKIKIPEGLHVAAYEPINKESVDFFEDLEKYIQIAYDPFGGRYIVDPTKDDPEVYLHYYDVGRDPEWFRSTGLRLSEFIAAKKIVSKE
ncbi:hypothetical protein SAMN02745181_0500 [Rubritalea squalenifaciens DSM 18772]|uniref:SMI1 / KNR4 family (SUKH-1) n=1 Tax=Rubritalea squalenifaciens DSM 18772 TaxID=1123071 RepID=A0A1M6CK02_9BACT|nr:hypothetical protein [Rubritalea squalenifaciens]SHI61350.1 hypothetical protein SAMN02745181_0500 [Rubritalea squalenifaciens DSM 18772]